MNTEDSKSPVNNLWAIFLTCLISVIVAIRLFVNGRRCPSNAKLNGKTALITGASGGIGLETAKQLAKRGANIILTCRNLKKGEKSVKAIKKQQPESNITLKLLDVSVLSEIHKFVNILKKDVEKIDILINNAGIVFHPHEVTTEGFELTLATNYLGPFTLTHLLLPLLKKSDNGRVINVTADAHFSAQLNLDNLNSEKEFMYREVFGQTKLALLMFTRHMAKLLKSTRITVNAVNPGLVRNTEHLRHSSLETSLFTKILVWPWVWLFMKTPFQGCQTIIYAAVEPQLQKATGAYFSNCELQQPSAVALDDNLAKKLYENTCRLSKINGENLIVDLNNVNRCLNQDCPAP